MEELCYKIGEKDKVDTSKVKIEVFSFDENRKIIKKDIEVSPEQAQKILSENTVLGEDDVESQLQELIGKEDAQIITTKLRQRLRNLLKKKKAERSRST